MNIKEQVLDIPKEKFPSHILIIPDGNGRWAQSKGKSIAEGHLKGFKVSEKILKKLYELENLKYLTLWGFSSDNWKREKSEVDYLMSIFDKIVQIFFQDFLNSDIRFIHLGRKDRIPASLRSAIEKLENLTKDKSKRILSLALDFGGEDQLLRMINKAKLLEAPLPFDTKVLNLLKDGEGLVPPADLLIRTSGERRTSDIGWLNGASTELYFLEKYFPDVNIEDIYNAIIDFSQRERRFGKRI